MIALYPGRQVSPLIDGKYSDAAKVSLNARGDASTGWATAWRINCWARLYDGNRALSIFRKYLLGGNTLANLFDTHPPFQIDGNFGGTAGIAEMLLQSHLGFTHLLPALPDDWQKGSIKGLRARGAFEIDLEWANNTLTKGTITSFAGDTCHLRYKTSTLDFPTVKGTKYLISYNGSNLILDGTSDPDKYKAQKNSEKWITCFQQSKQKRTIFPFLGYRLDETLLLPARETLLKMNLRKIQSKQFENVVEDH